MFQTILSIVLCKWCLTVVVTDFIYYVCLRFICVYVYACICCDETGFDDSIIDLPLEILKLYQYLTCYLYADF